MRLRLFSHATHLKVVLTLSLLQNVILKSGRQLHQDNFQQDIALCPNCFLNQYAKCLSFYETIVQPDELKQLLNSLQFTGKRNIQTLEIRRLLKSFIVLAKRYSFNILSTNWNAVSMEENFRKSFPKLGGFNYCNIDETMAFRIIDYFKRLGYSEKAILLYMHENITPLLMPELSNHQFPVPHVHAACGFSIYQAYAGRTLVHYLNADFKLRLLLAKQLLELTLQLTYGFNGFRIYLTDLTADNLAYDESARRLTIIDIDSIIMVDAGPKHVEATIRRYEIIPSDDISFSFKPEEFCKSSLYDVNIYEACQLLADHLLQAIPVTTQSQFPELRVLMTECMSCPVHDCKHRFGVAYRFLALIDNILAVTKD